MDECVGGSQLAVLSSRKSADDAASSPLGQVDQVDRRIDRPHKDLDDVIAEAERVVPASGGPDVARLSPEVLGEVHATDALVKPGVVPA